MKGLQNDQIQMTMTTLQPAYTDEHRLFLNSRADPTFWKPDDMTRMGAELARQHTVGLESDPTYLAALARHEW